ncbi:hypothetical protein BN7_2751 [Wickerhamomyces ciferrii]|uniref:F-box domain-containing protein n=1 Tax=Wickerhamomyces ciferrii (strain ATCC 14091 / BCRC 22168 / CBS 111 / JCM 3599 / NBRC 0793 / NRRL Y-1031 F-60-10) TaxID=1206466 RepID=K0KP91_WICCF|nr:uncharacterized protein BN7_2751 [Wickerhamomyces ciferrii]CCH43204.1 hypothetical protein BN7_2751 [Wickerhamomyces ciferrii]
MSERSPKRRRVDSLDQYNGAKTTILSLPDECLREVTKNLTQKDTLSLLYSHSHFQNACKARLYKRIIITEGTHSTYATQLANNNKLTLLDGWGAINRFFNKIYTSQRLLIEPEGAKFVEEIITMDSLYSPGALNDESKSSDLKSKIETLKNHWPIVMNSFVRLKYIHGYKLSFEKLVQLNSNITSNLRELSIGMNEELLLGSSQNYDIQLPKLKVLKLNFLREVTKQDARPFRIEYCTTLAKMLTINGSADNSTLERLEINAYLTGFENGNSRATHFLAPYCSNGLDVESDYPEEDVDSDIGLEMDGEKDLDDDVFNKTSKQFEVHYLTGVSKALNEYKKQPRKNRKFSRRKANSEDYEKFLGNVRFKYSDNSFPFPPNEILSLLLQGLADNNIRLLNVKSFGVANMNFDKRSLFLGSPLLKNLEKVLPNINDLETLDFRNVTHEAYIVDRYGSVSPEEEEAFKYDHTPSFLIHFIYGNKKKFEKLKKLVYFVTPNVDAGDPYRNHCHTNHYAKLYEQLKEFTVKSPNLEELVVFGPVRTQLRHFYRCLYQSSAKNTLMKLTYHQTELISKLSSKIINARIFRKFIKHSNLKVLEEYHTGCSQKLTEHFNLTTRLENYDNNESLRIHTVWVYI